MDELSIKVSIGNREYPLKINRLEEARVRSAVQMIQARIKEYEQVYPVGDKYDHLAMCVMHIAGELAEMTESHQQQQQQMRERMQRLDQVLSASLTNSNVL